MGEVTRGFGDLKLRVWTILASGDRLKGEEIFEMRELVSLFWALMFG